MLEGINFCHQCGYALVKKRIEGKVRPFCPNCKNVIFMDPKVAAVVLISMEGKLVLVKRNIEPALGHWAFPSGYIDRGEVVEDGARREVMEETGLEVHLDQLIGIYSSSGSPIVLAVYSAHPTGGVLKAGQEVQQVALFPLDELPHLPFPDDYEILRNWMSLSPE